MAWRDKLAAVQRRRAMLEDSMRSEANRLVEARAKRQVLFASVGSASREQPFQAFRHSEALTMFMPNRVSGGWKLDEGGGATFKRPAIQNVNRAEYVLFK